MRRTTVFVNQKNKQADDKGNRQTKQGVERVFNTCDNVENIEISRLFDRFYRQDKSHSDKTAGSGIGLSIVRATVQAHGGIVRAEKKDGGRLYLGNSYKSKTGKL